MLPDLAVDVMVQAEAEHEVELSEVRPFLADR
jgi:hypothetical protein